MVQNEGEVLVIQCDNTSYITISGAEPGKPAHATVEWMERYFLLYPQDENRAITHYQCNLKLSAPLFEEHPSINRVVRFTNDERHSALVYLAKIWRLMRSERYDVVIDMRSTVNTLPFSLFSLCSPFRIGLKKPYTRFVFNHRVEPCDPFTDRKSVV